MHATPAERKIQTLLRADILKAVSMDSVLNQSVDIT